MKKLLSIILATFVLSFCLMGAKSKGCYKTLTYRDTENTTSMFVMVEETHDWCVVYHKKTKVMYAVSLFDAHGVFTLLVNPDGTPMLWEE